MEEHDDRKPINNDDCEKERNACGISCAKLKMVAIVIVTLFIQFWALCSDSVITVFFGNVARSKGLSYSQIGIVFSSYDLARFISSPLAGSLVSMHVCVVAECWQCRCVKYFIAITIFNTK